MSEPRQPANDAEEQPLRLPTPCPSLSGRGDYSDDPETAALLDFEPVPRAQKVRGEWTPALQRELVARVAEHGSIQQACEAMEKCRSGVNKLRKHKRGASFSAAIDAAIALARRRLAEVDAMVERMEPGLRQAPVDYRRKNPLAPAPVLTRGEGPLPGQVRNEHGEYEDEESFERRGEEAIDNICAKLVRCRRAFLAEISGSPGKRAAFEILTELPVDWELAARLAPQPFEPWTRTNMREPDMVLTAESGWMSGMVPYGPPKVAEMRRAIDAHRASEGLEPVDWDAG